MQGSLRRLLTEAIDYAGLFPPASLALKDAVEEYRCCVNNETSWLMGRFSCPVKDLAKLAEIIDDSKESSKSSLRITAIGAPTKDREHWNQVREQEATALNEFQTKVSGAAEIEALEVRLPSHLDIDHYFRDLQGFASVSVYAELPWDLAMSDSIAAAAESEWLFLKARTGGLSSTDIPASQQLAEFIGDCTSLDIPFKLTAGLHHPLRHRLPDGSKGHGFINVLTATVLSLAEDLPPTKLIQILESEQPADWSFEDKRFRWRNHDADILAIDNGRSLFDSFGSCSIEEPLEGLKALGWQE